MANNSTTLIQNLEWLPQVIVSGGQTGVDRAALDWAISHQILHDGWCPKGRMAADGSLSLTYRLLETESAGYRQRTKLNVRDTDATLIFNTGALDGGTLATVRFTQAMHKPHLVLQLDELGGQTVPKLIEWLRTGQFVRLNVAGPREEKRPGIYSRVFCALEQVLQSCIDPQG